MRNIRGGQLYMQAEAFAPEEVLGHICTCDKSKMKKARALLRPTTANKEATTRVKVGRRYSKNSFEVPNLGWLTA
jgi:hypothetical protein